MADIDKKLSRLIDIMSVLLGEKGCPWDRRQTHKSLRQHLLEETYEVIETIDEERYEDLPGELGDLLLQVVFHAQMAAEKNLFDMNDVLGAINAKLIRRHPHVFGEVKNITADEQIVLWEQSKLKNEGKKSAVDGVPRELPALLRAYRMQNKAATVGFDWPEIEPVWDKVHEELDELKEAVASHQKDAIMEELGDLLFSIVNLSRFLKANPEDALRETIAKFEKRFKKVEQDFKSRNLDMKDASLEDMDKVWEKVKELEKKKTVLKDG